MGKRIILTAFLLVLASAAVALAGDEWRERHRRVPDRFQEFVDLPGLNLTAEQRAKITALGEAHRRESEPLRGQLISRGRELRTLWLAKTPDRERIVAVQAEVQALRAQLSGKAEGSLQEARRLLTPEQQERWDAFERERSRHRERMMRHRPPMGGGPRQRGPRGGAEGKGGE